MTETVCYTAPASTPSEMRTVYSLRREAFHEGAPTSGEGLKDDYDDRPNCRSFLLRTGAGEPIGTVRVCHFSCEFGWLPIPAFDLYEEELRGLGENRTLLQSTFFAVSSAHRGAALGPKLLLIREVLRAATDSGCDFVVTIVRSRGSQVRFYGRMGFRPLGPTRVHPLAGREAVLVGVPTGQFLDAVRGSRTLSPIGDFAARRSAAHAESGDGVRVHADPVEMPSDRPPAP
jgi:predicted N-acetyltransferase YhbS